jgi:hypothetical protein
MRWRSGASSLAKGSSSIRTSGCANRARAKATARAVRRTGWPGRRGQSLAVRLRSVPPAPAGSASMAGSGRSKRAIGPSESTRRAAAQSPPRRAQTRPRRCRHLPTRRVRFGHALQAPPMRQRLGLRSPKLADSKARAQPLPRPAAKPPAQCTGSENTGGGV